MLLLKAILGLAFLLGVLGAVLFGLAGTLAFTPAWGFLGVFGVGTAAVTIDLALHDPALLARRTQAGPVAETRSAQRVIQFIAQFAFLSLFVLSALDHRFGWSHVPDAMVLAGDALVALGLCCVWLVFRENSFTSATIEVGAEQRVVSTGPYALVRHPMYAGALVLILGTPLALASWWGFAGVPGLVGVIVARLLDEERFLARELPGYPEYAARVRWRLVPGLF